MLDSRNPQGDHHDLPSPCCCCLAPSADNPDEKQKKPLSAYFKFSAAQRAVVKSELAPSATTGEIAKELGRRWRELSAEEQAAYKAHDRDENRA